MAQRVVIEAAWLKACGYPEYIGKALPVIRTEITWAGVYFTVEVDHRTDGWVVAANRCLCIG